MWDTVGNIAAIIVIILLFQLLGLSDRIDLFLKKRKSVPNLEKKIAELEERIVQLEKKCK